MLKNDTIESSWTLKVGAKQCNEYIYYAATTKENMGVGEGDVEASDFWHLLTTTGNPPSPPHIPGTAWEQYQDSGNGRKATFTPFLLLVFPGKT